MNPRTKKNLTTAMECDAFASAKYQRFAARARMDENWELAKAFQKTADSDRTQHFAKEAQLEGLIASSADNLRNAIETETKQRRLYAQFATEAREDGDLAVAVALDRIVQDKATDCAEFERVLQNMGIHGYVEVIGG